MGSNIGERVKSLRMEQGMTLAELGEKVSLSTSYLSQIERNRTNPSLTTLMDIASSLNVEPRYFFESGDETALVRRANQQDEGEVNQVALMRYPLSAEDVSNTLHVYRVVIQSHSPSHEFAPYRGEEMVFVLSGELRVVVADEGYLLEAGDSIHYDALLFHSWTTEGEMPCEVLWSRASYSKKQIRLSDNPFVMKEMDGNPARKEVDHKLVRE